MTARRQLPFAIAALLMLAACADDPPAAGDGTTPTPSDGSPADGPTIPAEGVVLRIANEGGFVPAGFSLVDVPVFTLYGDGTIITPGAQIAIYPSPALPAIVEREVDPAAVRAIAGRGITLDCPRGTAIRDCCPARQCAPSPTCDSPPCWQAAGCWRDWLDRLPT